ncbi:HET-domain-containing protein [Xylaria sp. FL1042]|nr:HET-domain-containing protein [Xylaria sp. FL1042]
MPKFSSWKTGPGGIRVPPLRPVPSDIVKPNDALCHICQAIDFDPEYFYASKKQQGRLSSCSDEDEDDDEKDEGEEEEEDDDDDGNNDEDDDDSIVLSCDNESDSAGEGTDEADDEEESSETSSSFEQDFASLGKLADVRRRTHCPFCRLALAAVGGARVPDTKDGEPVTLKVSVQKDDDGTRVLMPSASAGSEDMDLVTLFPEIVPLANDLPDSPVCLVRPIDREKIDFAVVRNWLSVCESVHGDECRKRPGMDDFPVHPATILNEFRLIDVKRNCLVRATSDDKYAALSYVWGQAKVLRAGMANVESLEKLGAFNKPEFNPPQTIKDAIQATREMGIGYLWVDALCIIQDEGYKEKLPHIKQMNRIYETAELVIVAMSSRDAGFGIPGVRPWTRDAEQHIEQITPQLRLGIRTSYGNDSMGCIYSTRGWTYQETGFARRQLIFTGGQAVFICKYAGNWSEDSVVEDHDFMKREMLEDGSGGMWDGDDKITSYEAPIQNYSDRTLSFSSDIYNAFAGVSQRMRDLLKTDLCHGIPPRYFDWCLLWDPMNKQTRRQGTPSWSWSGWEGGTFPRIWDWYEPKTRRIQNALKVRTWIIWYHRVAHGSTDCRLVWDWTSEKGRARGKKKNFYGGEVQSRFRPLDCSRTQPTKRMLTGAPTYYPDILCDAPGSGFLQFWTVAVKFQLNKPDSSPSEDAPTWFRDHTRLGIFGRWKRELGTIQVANTWLEKTPGLPLTREFILLCEGRDERAEDYSHDEEPGWKYKVMLLEWHGDYAERVAVGSINKGDEMESLESSPTWKEIILG